MSAEAFRATTCSTRCAGRRNMPPTSPLPDMLHGRFVRSTYPYARIKRVDVSTPRVAPGGPLRPDGRRHSRRPPAGRLARQGHADPREGRGAACRRADRCDRGRDAGDRHAATALVEIEYEPLDAGADAAGRAQATTRRASIRMAISSPTFAMRSATSTPRSLRPTRSRRRLHQRADRALLTSKPQAAFPSSTPTACSRCWYRTQYPHFHHKQLAARDRPAAREDARHPNGRGRRLRRQDRRDDRMRRLPDDAARPAGRSRWCWRARRYSPPPPSATR